MAGDGISGVLRGLPELREVLRGIVPKLRKKALREALRAGARVVQRGAQRAAPVLKASTFSGASALRRGVRRIGTMRRAIAVRTSKLSTRQGNVGVFVNVRPAKQGQRGAKNPNDPYYWRWQNFGWNPAGDDRSRAGKRERRRLNRSGAPKRKQGVRFLEAGAQLLRQALAVFVQEIGPRIARLNQGKNAQP